MITERSDVYDVSGLAMTDEALASLYRQVWSWQRSRPEGQLWTSGNLIRAAGNLDVSADLIPGHGPRRIPDARGVTAALRKLDGVEIGRYKLIRLDETTPTGVALWTVRAELTT
jgi:hypothetical protein